MIGAEPCPAEEKKSGIKLLPTKERRSWERTGI